MPLVVWSTATLGTLSSGLTPWFAHPVTCCAAEQHKYSWCLFLGRVILVTWRLILPVSSLAYLLTAPNLNDMYSLALIACINTLRLNIWRDITWTYIPLCLWTLMHFTFYEWTSLTQYIPNCSAQTAQPKVLLSFPAVPVSHFFLSGSNELSVMLMPLQGWQ